MQGGDRLPAERVLCEELGVSRTALRAAITRLISCGTLESRRGSGTYVCPPKPLNIFQETWNYSEAVETVGLHSTARLVSTGTIEADDELADRAQSDCRRYSATHAARATDQRRAGVDRDGSRQPVLCPSLTDHDFERESLYDVLLKEGDVHVEHGREHISIRRLNVDEAELLEQEEGTPVFYKARTNATRTCVLWSIASR